jgi:hypothetical protein
MHGRLTRFVEFRERGVEFEVPEVWDNLGPLHEEGSDVGEELSVTIVHTGHS